MSDAATPNPDSFQTDFASRTVSRDDGITSNVKKRKKKATKHLRKKRTKSSKHLESETGADDAAAAADAGGKERVDPMRKLYAAHPRHVVKVILKKLCAPQYRAQFHRMLGSFGMLLQSSGVSLEELLLSASNSVPQTLRERLKYDIGDQRVMLLARLAVHRFLAGQGTKLKSALFPHDNLTATLDTEEPSYDGRNELTETHRNIKDSLQFIPESQILEAIQNSDTQEILNGLSFADKHRLYEILRQDLENVDHSNGGFSAVHQHCTGHITPAVPLPAAGNAALPTVLKHDDKTTWNGRDVPLMQLGAAPPMEALVAFDENGETVLSDDSDMDGLLTHEKPDLAANVSGTAGLLQQQRPPMMGSRQSLPLSVTSRSTKRKPTKADVAESAAKAAREEQTAVREAYAEMVGAAQKQIENTQMAHPEQEYKYTRTAVELAVAGGNFGNLDLDFQLTKGTKENEKDSQQEERDLALLSSLQTKVDILVRYNHVSWHHLEMALKQKRSVLPELYVSLERMREWELARDDEIALLSAKKTECAQTYGRDIDELNVRKALLAREINESKVCLERIADQVRAMRSLFETAKSELHAVNEVHREQELRRDEYLTQFDEKWTFEWQMRAAFQAQTRRNEAVKRDAKFWQRKLEQLKTYTDSDQVWQELKENIWKFGRDNRRVAEHYQKLLRINDSRQNVYRACVAFWNDFVYTHANGGSGSGKEASQRQRDVDNFQSLYDDILLQSTKVFSTSTSLESDSKWTYREQLYQQAERGIDVRATELDLPDLWRLVVYQEGGEATRDLYEQYAHPRKWQAKQEQLQVERRERVQKNLQRKKSAKRKINPRQQSVRLEGFGANRVDTPKTPLLKNSGMSGTFSVGVTNFTPRYSLSSQGGGGGGAGGGPGAVPRKRSDSVSRQQQPDIKRRNRKRGTSISNNNTALPTKTSHNRAGSNAQTQSRAAQPVLKDRVSADKYSPAIGSNVGQSQRFAHAQQPSNQTYQSEASMFQASGQDGGRNWTPSTPADMGLSQRFNQFNPDASSAGIGNVGQSMQSVQSTMTGGVNTGIDNMYSFSGGSFATPRAAYQQQQQQHAPGQQSMVSMGSQRMFAQQQQSMSALPYQASMTAGFQQQPYGAYDTPQTNVSDGMGGRGMSQRFSVTQPQRHSIASQGLPTMQDVEPDYDDADDETDDAGDSEYE